ncbi:MAG: cytochrome c [Hyphomicrobiales bacterium]|nr:cytochrome c [Hyphomicrobiales bacterium]
MSGIRVLLSFVASMTIAVPAHAGMELVQEHCARCHAIAKTGDSPLADAPPFREIAQRYPAESLAESLAEGIVTGHAEMPEFVFSPGEVGQLVDYFASLAKDD